MLTLPVSHHKIYCILAEFHYASWLPPVDNLIGNVLPVLCLSYDRLTLNFATAIFTNDFPSITCALPFLKSIASKLVSSQISSQAPSDDVLTFLDRIERADPNSPDISEDDTNESWGHYQYTAAGLTYTAVLTSWESIGNIDTACRLIAAAIKTCKVARHLCFAQHLSPTSYLSEIYMNNIVELLLQLWSATDGNNVRLDSYTLNY